METTSLTAKNHTYNHHHHQHHHSQPQPHKHHHNLIPPSILIIILPILIVLFLLAILVIIVLLRHLKSAKDKKSNRSKNGIIINRDCMVIAQTTIGISASPDVKGGCLYGGSSGRIPSAKFKEVQVFSYKELEAATDKFSEANVIGNRGFGVVAYRGVLSDGTLAEIKRLHREGKQGERAFRMEVDLLSHLHSSYLVQLLGYCADQHHRLLIVEFMHNGTLHHHLHPSHNQPPPLNWGTRLRIALDCARALEFLHEHTIPSVIHRDFNSSNILLDQNLKAKVSDFGLARTGSDKINGQISTRVLGTTGYLAPEYASKGKLTTKSDVYSYGVVLLELLTGRVPIDKNRPPGEHVLVSWALPRLTIREKVVEMVDPSLEGQYSKKDLIQVAAIAAMCVQQAAEYRPLMTDVVQSLIPLVKNISSLCLSKSNSLQFSPTVSPKS